MRKDDKGIDKYFAKRRKIVGVMGSGTDRHENLASPLGEAIAKMDCHILTGAGRGTMEVVSLAFRGCEGRQGSVIGIVRADEGRQRKDYRPKKTPNKAVEIPIFTHLEKSDSSINSRNHINVLSSDAIVVLPGGRGTRSEVKLAIDYGWPIVFFLGDQKLSERTAKDLAKKYADQKDVFFAKDIDDVRFRLNQVLFGGINT